MINAIRMIACGAIMGSAVWVNAAVAASLAVDIHKVDDSGTGEQIGKVTFQDTDLGLLIIPDLQGLEPGQHGFHVHENPDCGPRGRNKTGTAKAAGSH